MSKIDRAYTTRDRTMERILIGTGVLNQRIKDSCCIPNGLKKTQALMDTLFDKAPSPMNSRPFTEDEKKLFDRLSKR